MNRNKTVEEIANSMFMSKADIRKMFRFGSDRAKAIFDRADLIDAEEIRYRVFDDRVRTTSVCKVLGITVEQLKKAYCNTPK